MPQMHADCAMCHPQQRELQVGAQWAMQQESIYAGRVSADVAQVASRPQVILQGLTY